LLYKELHYEGHWMICEVGSCFIIMLISSLFGKSYYVLFGLLAN